MRVLVTGGAGFIGSALVLELVRNRGAEVLTLDALTYAANPASLAPLEGDPHYRLIRVDVTDTEAVTQAIAAFRPQAIVHAAAETHVDRSITGPMAFVRTNVAGTASVLQAALTYWNGLRGAARDAFRFLHMSTDEVFGSLPEVGRFTELSSYAPRSPYAASKAAGDHMVRAWGVTYGLPTMIAHPCNAFGPRQFPEKLIPLMILNAAAGQPLPIYGDGLNVRDWLHVEDVAGGLLAILERGRVQESYCLPGAGERTNLELVRTLCAHFDRLRPDNAPHDRHIVFVADRPGHDRRYASDGAKVARELGFRPRIGLAEGLESTIRWYLDNEDWWQPVRLRSYRGERLGLLTPAEPDGS